MHKVFAVLLFVSVIGVVFKLFQKIHNYQNSATNRKVSNSAIKEIIKQNELGAK